VRVKPTGVISVPRPPPGRLWQTVWHLLLSKRELLAQMRIGQKEGHLLKKGEPDNMGKALFSFFLGFIVQSAPLRKNQPNVVA
jgi:hypothetical protein